jgi:hypothetical protein
MIRARGSLRRGGRLEKQEVTVFNSVSSYRGRRSGCEPEAKAAVTRLATVSTAMLAASTMAALAGP